MSGPVEYILDRLEGVRQSGRSHMAKCPAHDDRSPSLRVSEGDDGRALVFCLAGCTTDDVLDAIGLSRADLFPPRTEAERCEHRRAALQRAMEHERLVLKMAALSTVPLSDADRSRAALARRRVAKITQELGDA